MKQKIAMCGFGAFNTSIAHHLDKKTSDDCKIMFWDGNPDIAVYFDKHKSHPQHFSDIKFSDKVTSVSVEELVVDADYVIIGVGSQAVREVIQKFTPYLNKPSIITIIAKGFESVTHKRLSQVAKEELSKSKYSHEVTVFSGGTVAKDIANGVPLIAEVASTSKEAREKVADLFHTKNLRIYTNEDVLSVELAGALKNVVSLGAGIAAGLGYGIGTQSSFITRTSFEIYKLAKTLGAKEETFLPGSASFWGDIMLSSFGDTRNKEYGKRIVGNSPEKVLEEMKKEFKTVEGYYSVKAAFELVNKHKVDAPCIATIYRIVYEALDPKDALTQLMTRDRKSISKL